MQLANPVMLVFTSLPVDEALDDIIDMMETLLKDYSNQDKQLNRIHGKLALVKHGYNSLRHELSTVECSMSGAIGESSNAAECLDQHKEQTATDLCDIQTCINDACVTLDRIEDFVHPCGEGNWRDAVLQVYSNFATNCPGDWEELLDGSDRFCARSTASPVPNTCDSATFQVDGEYSRVCGRIRAFHGGMAAAFDGSGDIDSDYLSGLSLTHGMPPRQHIWSLAIGQTEDSSLIAAGDEGVLCPCHDDGEPSTIPAFVGDDYFCEAALEDPFVAATHNTALFLEDLLWDGNDCTNEADCCNAIDLPYFDRILPAPTCDDLEIRMCLPVTEFNILIQQIEIYVL